MATVKTRYKRAVLIFFLSALIGGAVFSRLHDQTRAEKRNTAIAPIPVKVSPIQHGPIELRRMFSGTLAPTAQFVAAPKVSGRIETLYVDLADPVIRGQEVAKLDDDEYVQAVAQARADLAVANANLEQAGSALEIADRELSRVVTLQRRGVASESQLDVMRTGQLQKKAALAVAKTQKTKAEAFLETAIIKFGYTRVTADWVGGGTGKRVVAERHVDQGSTVSANAPLLTIVELNPITGVIFITEKDYTRLKNNQSVELTTDAFPGETFLGHITRIAPVFNQATRQARVEMTIENPAHRLKPGMFIRAAVVLDRVSDAVIVPEQALTQRSDRSGVFLLTKGSKKVQWREVATGIRQGDWVQVTGSDLSGDVVILGQQLLSDGAPVTLFEADTPHEPHEGAAE